MAIPSAGASLLLTVHSLGAGGTIIAAGGVIAKTGIDMVWDALKDESPTASAGMASAGPGGVDSGLSEKISNRTIGSSTYK